LFIDSFKKPGVAFYLKINIIKNVFVIFYFFLCYGLDFLEAISEEILRKNGIRIN